MKLSISLSDIAGQCAAVPRNIAADAFGNALGQGLVDSMGPQPSMWDIDEQYRAQGYEEELRSRARASTSNAAWGSAGSKLRPATGSPEHSFGVNAAIDSSLVPDGMSARLPYIDNRDIRARMTTVNGQLVDFEAFDANANTQTPTFVDPETGSEYFALGGEPTIVAQNLMPPSAMPQSPSYIQEMRSSSQVRYLALQDDAIADRSPMTYYAAKLASLAGDVGYEGMELAAGAYSLATSAAARQNALRIANYLVDRPETLLDMTTAGINDFIRSPSEEKAGSLFKASLGLLAGSGAGRAFGSAAEAMLGEGQLLSRMSLQTGGRQVVNPSSLRSWELADEAYALIRTNGNDIAAIADNIGWSEARVARVKEHVFFREHRLDGGLARFDSDPAIVNAWDRLVTGDHVKADLDLMRHEIFESKFEGIFRTDYRTAHEAALRAKRFWTPE